MKRTLNKLIRAMREQSSGLVDVATFARTWVERRLTHVLANVATTAALISAALTSVPLYAADSAPTNVASSEVRDVILVLDHGPLHLRVHVAVGGLSPQDARRASLDRLVKSLDADGDGKLSQKEAERSPLFREKQRPKAEAFLKDIGGSTAFSRKDMEQRFERLGGETVVYRQNASSSESDNSVFKLFDANKDGVVDATEMQDSVDLLLAKDGDDDECVTLDEFAPPPTTNADQTAIAMNPPRPQTVADLLRDTNQTLLPAQLLQKYDKDRNRKLSAEELGWSKERIATCDTDKDGQLNLKELGGLKNSPIDIELAVDVIRKAGQSMLTTLAVSGNRTDGDRVPDLATIRLPTAVVTHLGRWPKGDDPSKSKFSQCSVRTPRWHLVSDAKLGEKHWQLFDLTNDPGEQSDLATQHATVVNELENSYDAWWDSIQPQLVNEAAIGPAENPFKTRFEQQFGRVPANNP